MSKGFGSLGSSFLGVMAVFWYGAGKRLPNRSRVKVFLELCISNVTNYIAIMVYFYVQ